MRRYDNSPMADDDDSAPYPVPRRGSLEDMDAAWLKAELAKGRRSQSALARFLGLPQESVNRMCSGKRQIKANEADQIRAYLAATESGGATISPLSTGASPTALLTVRGTVEAGSWREVHISDVTELEAWPAPRHVVEAGAFALRVAGPSMNQLYPDGSYVVVQPWHGGPMPIGKRVVVERVRPDGLVETTVKELRQGAGGYELWPRSDHPAYQTPVSFDETDGVTVRLIGTVTLSFRPEI